MKRRIFPGGIFILFACSCAFLPPRFQPSSGGRNGITDSARSLLGKRYQEKAVVAGKTFTLDCIGTVSAVYWDGAGIDLMADLGKYAGNGVNRLHKSMAEKSALMRVDGAPIAGDILFWDNTWDANEDGIPGNDGHTHAGIVVEVDDDGTVTYVHASVSRGIVTAFLNLKHPETSISPEGKVLNSPMYLGSSEGKKTNPPKWRSGELISGWANADVIILRHASVTRDSR